MTTTVQKSQIIKSIDNLHLKGTIDKGLEKNSLPLFSSFTNGAINISEVGLYQVIDTMIEQLLDIKNKDNIIRSVGINISSQDYYTTSLNRYSLKNREKQLYNVLQKAPIVNNNNNLLDLSNNIDGSASSTDLTCKIVYKDTLYNDSDGTPITTGNTTFTEANLKSNEFISLQTPTKYDANGVRISGEKKFVLRDTLSGPQEAYDNAYNNAIENGDNINTATDAGDTARTQYNIDNPNIKFFYRATDNCIEFLRETDTDTTINNLILALKSVFGDNNVVKNATSKTITITQPNTDGIIIDNISLFTDGIQLPIQNFRSLRYKQFFANTISKTSSLNTRGNTGLNDTRLSLLIVGYDSNGIPVKKYSEDALFEFFGKMTYEFIKLNNNHIGAEKYYPGGYINASGDIGTHHLNSVKDLEDDPTNNINRNNIIKQLHNIKKNGSFGSVGFNNTGRRRCVITYDDTFYTNNIGTITRTYFVTVQAKTSSHPYNGVGSSSAYYIDGIESPTLNLIPGTYTFDQSNSVSGYSNSGHPLRFYTSADKSVEYTTNVTTSITHESPPIFPGNTGAYTRIVITSLTPTLYYQCSNHGYMGGDLTINNNNFNIELYNGTTAVRFILRNTSPLPNNNNTEYFFLRDNSTQTTMSNLTNSINQYSNFDATHDSSKNRIIVTQIITKDTPDNTNNNTINNLTEITLSDFYLLPNQFGVKSSTLREQYGYFSEILFSDTISNRQNIPHRDDDPNAIGLYQIINNLIYQLQFFKKKIKKREKELIRILKDSSSSSNSIDLDSNKANNLQALTTYCRQQGGLNTNLHKPSFVEIINTTDYTGSDEIDYRYSQDALYELCGRWLNELLKLNNGHSGYENIYPGFFDINKTFISQHHLNSVTTFTQL